MTDRPSIVPYFSYADGHAALKFLKDAFGFEVVQAYNDADGALMHAELAFGNGVIMVGSGEAAKGFPGIYVVVADVVAHCAQAKATGAEIVYPPESTEWGTLRYRCRDPEGHEWSFGSYQPQTTVPDWG